MQLKVLLVIGLVLVTACGGKNNYHAPLQTASNTDNATNGADNVSKAEDFETDEHVLTPELEALFEQEQSDSLLMGKATHQFKFPQTVWRECDDNITGNYTGVACSNARKMSVILKKFMDTHMMKCVNRGIADQGGGTAIDFHIVHAGIFGDPKHSPRSLHSENRAIDIKSMEVKLTTGKVKKFKFAGTTHRPFYKAFRKCWGEVVNKHNNCPLYQGTASLTATIGWEDKNHQQHMHTSVPYCVKGKYSPEYFQK